ncbi:carbohydrate porin [Leptothrix discophora]|uniref:Carbohydrate porin n=2 Tax=Leptothrix discophora TaxID=89 RepID=A0ABT9G447_LEPDI|nr:carbohydrate porin [Leptothrix discophora]MDP4301022.1 carbohydrate porin [Leptothrix discophora]
MWGQIGTSAFDVKFGRFEAADLFPVGKDVYVESAVAFADPTATVGYRANSLRGRTAGSVAHLALTANLGVASLEVGVVESKADGAVKGIRPAVSFNVGPASVKVGFESGQTNATAGGVFSLDPTTGAITASAAAAQEKFEGFGGTVGLPLAGGTVNLNAASGKNKTTDTKSSSYGVVGVFGPAGVALISDKTGNVKQTTVYAAYSLPLFNTGATITPAVSSSRSSGLKTVSGAALRVNYTF